VNRLNKVFIATFTVLAGIGGAVFGSLAGQKVYLRNVSGAIRGSDSPPFVPLAEFPPPVIPADPLLVIACALGAMALTFLVLYAFATRPVR